MQFDDLSIQGYIVNFACVHNTCIIRDRLAPIVIIFTYPWLHLSYHMIHFIIHSQYTPVMDTNTHLENVLLFTFCVKKQILLPNAMSVQTDVMNMHFLINVRLTLP